MPDAGLSAGIETNERKKMRFLHSPSSPSRGGETRPGQQAFAQTSVWEPVMKGGGATGLGGFLKEMTLMLRSGRSFQTEVDRMHGELCGGRGTSEHRGHVKAGEGERGAGTRTDRLEECSGAGPCGPGSLSQGRDGIEGWRGGDVTRLAFQDIPLAAAWRTD